MKNIEELKSWFEDDKLYVGEYVKRKIDQLDEPEVNSQIYKLANFILRSKVNETNKKTEEQTKNYYDSQTARASQTKCD